MYRRADDCSEFVRRRTAIGPCILILKWVGDEQATIGQSVAGVRLRGHDPPTALPFVGGLGIAVGGAFDGQASALAHDDDVMGLNGELRAFLYIV